MICRNCNLSTNILFKGSDDGLVEGYAALEKDVLADRLARNDAVNIVLDDGIGKAGKKIVLLMASLEVCH